MAWHTTSTSLSRYPFTKCARVHVSHKDGPCTGVPFFTFTLIIFIRSKKRRLPLRKARLPAQARNYFRWVSPAFGRPAFRRDPERSEGPLLGSSRPPGCHHGLGAQNHARDKHTHQFLNLCRERLVSKEPLRGGTKAHSATIPAQRHRRQPQRRIVCAYHHAECSPASPV